MATVDAFTKARTQAIEDGAVVSGAVVGDNLILTTHAGDDIDAGDVRGPIGPVDLGMELVVVAASLITCVDHKEYYYDGSNPVVSHLPAATVGVTIRFKNGPTGSGYFSIQRAGTDTFEDGSTSPINLIERNGWVEVHCGAAGVWSVIASFGWDNTPYINAGKVLVFDRKTKKWLPKQPVNAIVDLHRVGKPSGSGAVYQNSWHAYSEGNVYALARFYKDAKGMAHIDGLVAAGTGTIFTLPSEFWPPFPVTKVINCASGHTTVQIGIDGKVSQAGSYHGTGANNVYFQLDGLSWWPTDSPAVWTNITPPGAWTNFSADYAPLSYYVDVDNLCHFRALLKGGASQVGGGSAVSSWLMPFDPLFPQYLRYGGASEFPARVEIGLGASTSKSVSLYGWMTGGGNTWFSMDGVVYPTQYCTLDMMYMSLQNSWANYTVYPNALMYKDSANYVRWDGLIRSGSPSVAMNVPAPPPGYSIGRTGLFQVLANDQAARVDVTLYSITAFMQGYLTGGSNAWLSLDSIEYLAEGTP